MPLLRQEPFVRQPLPDDLRSDEEVFFCRLTSEVFRNYDDFFKRTILLNSMVWTCTVTGNSGLTYEEALTSERRSAKKKGLMVSEGEGLMDVDSLCIDEFESEKGDRFELAAALLVTFTTRGFLTDLVGDLVDYFKEHYFRDELVELMLDGKRRLGRIVRVLYEAVPDDGDQNDGSDSKHDKHCYRYVVKAQKHKNVVATVEVDGDALLRRKIPVTKVRCKTFIKENCDIVDSASYKLKSEVMERLKVSDSLWEELFAGPRPKFAATPLATRRSLTGGLSAPTPKDLEGLSEADVSAIEQRRQTLEQMGAEVTKFHLTVDLGVLLSADHRAAELALAELRAALKKARDYEKERQREEKRKLAEWKKPRDDLECDDQRPLPALRPLRFPPELSPDQLGDCFSLVEFLTCFAGQLHAKVPPPADDYSNAPFFQQLNSRRPNLDDNAFLKLLYTFLATLFPLAKEEEEEENLNEVETTTKPKVESVGELPDTEAADSEEAAQQQAALADRPFDPKHAHEASALHNAIKSAFGVSVLGLPLNHRTISEVLRLHLLTCGRHSESASLSRHRMQNRGSYKCSDDLPFAFRLRRADLIDHLTRRSVVELSLGDRLEILLALRDQLLSYPAFRAPLQQRLERLGAARQEWRQWGSLEQRWEREATQASADSAAASEEAPATAPSASAKTSETLALLRRYAEGGDSKRHKLKMMLLEGVDWAQLASGQEIEAARKIQKTFVLQEQIALRREIFQLRAQSGINHLGRDRAYRNYWLLNAYNAILVERNWGTEPLAQSQCCSVATPLDRTEPDNGAESLLVCTAQSALCPVHGSAVQQPFWWAVTDSATFQRLVTSLNPRGFRESELQENLKFYQSFLEMGDEEKFVLRSDDSFFITHQPQCHIAPKDDDDDGTEQSISDQYAVEMRARLLEFEESLWTRSLALDKASRQQWRNALCHSSGQVQSDEELLKSMVLSLHELASAINQKLLKFPFRPAKSSKESPAFELWRDLLLNDVFSWSRLFLFLDTLEHSVAWHKAASVAKTTPPSKLGSPACTATASSQLASCQQSRISRTGRAVKKPVSFGDRHLDRTVVPQFCSKKQGGGGAENAVKARSIEPKQLEKCRLLIRLATNHPDAWPFLKPVSKQDAPDYYQVIERPMDLQTIQQKLDRTNYATFDEFHKDVCQIFDNCKLYNEPCAPVYVCGENLRKYIDQKTCQLDS